MKVIGLAGGIGAGKSTVSTQLRELGAVVLDADLIAREMQEPGHDVFDQMVAAFGPGVVAPDGRLDRQAVANIVFADPKELERLNGITLPAIVNEIYRRTAEHEGTDAVVIIDAALIDRPHQYGEQATIVVDVPVDVAVQRLVAQRGLGEEDARNRIARQQSREDRLRIADFVIDNSGDAAQLAEQVAKAWAWIESLPGR